MIHDVGQLILASADNFTLIWHYSVAGTALSEYSSHHCNGRSIHVWLVGIGSSIT